MIPQSLLMDLAEKFDERLMNNPLELPLDLLPDSATSEIRSRAASMMLEIATERRGHGLHADSRWLTIQIADSTLGICRDDAIALARGLFTTELERRRRIDWRDFQGFGFSSEELQLAAPQDYLALGQILWDGIIVQERIAEGGVAVVYRAETSDLKPIAIKAPRKFEGGENDPFKAAIRQEATVLQQLELMGIPQFISFRDWGRVPLLTTEWIDAPHGAGFPLDATCNQKIGIVSTLARIVDQLHRRDLIHGDVKPHNLLIDRKRKVWLVDFNVTRSALPQNNPDGPLPGTHVMMSPEALVGVSADADIAQDIHSLGALLYEAITGDTMHHHAGREAALVASILLGGKHEATFPEATPEALKAICRVASSRHVHQRFVSAEDFAITLDQFLVGNLDTQHIPPPRPQIVAWRIGDALGRCLTRTRKAIEATAATNRDLSERLSRDDIIGLSHGMGIDLALEDLDLLLQRIGWKLPNRPDTEILVTSFYRGRKLLVSDLLPVRVCAEECESWFKVAWQEIQATIAPAQPSLFLLTSTSLQTRFTEGSATARKTWNKLASHAGLPVEVIERFDSSLADDTACKHWESAVRRLDYDVMKWLRWDCVES